MTPSNMSAHRTAAKERAARVVELSCIQPTFQRLTHHDTPMDSGWAMGQDFVGRLGAPTVPPMVGYRATKPVTIDRTSPSSLTVNATRVSPRAPAACMAWVASRWDRWSWCRDSSTDETGAPLESMLS